jgi:hypothetical protein
MLSIKLRSGLWLLVSGYWILDAGCSILDSRYKKLADNMHIKIQTFGWLLSRLEAAPTIKKANRMHLWERLPAANRTFENGIKS